MVDNQNLEKLIFTLAENADSVEVIGEVFGEIGENYGIAGIQLDFFVEEPTFMKESVKKQEFLYRSEDEISDSVGFEKHYVTGENGQVCFRVYANKEKNMFSEEEKADIELLINLIFIHCGRWRLINLIQYIGFTDSLTGLPNSGGFLTYMDGVLAQGKLKEYNAFYFNLSRFSLVNKKFGSRETDKIIVRYCNVLKAFLEEGERLGRLGGDNFVALIRKEKTEEFLSMLSGVEVSGRLGEGMVPVVISAIAGVVEIDETILASGQAIDGCSMAMNVAKHVDKKPYLFVTPELRKKSFRQKQIVSGFMEALHKGELCVYYQPQVHTQSLCITGAEALARWKQEGKIISPAEFIPIIEQTGLICALDFYILEQVCKDIKKWISLGITPIKVSVNFSRKHLSNPNLAKDIMDVLTKYQMESKYIEIELTETVDEAEAGLLIHFMEDMKRHQVSMAIDDFGTGYSSLNMLRSFPADVLKVDKSFIDNLEEKDKIVLSSIIHMADQLHMEVVAEGVEMMEQMEYLRENKCHIVQGFLFDRPMPEEQFESRLRMGSYSLDDLKNK